MGVEVEDLAEEVVVGVVARVQAARDGAPVAEGVLGVRHLCDLREDRGVVDGLFRHSPVRLGRAPVRVEIAEDLLESGVAHLFPLLVPMAARAGVLEPAWRATACGRTGLARPVPPIIVPGQPPGRSVVPV